MDHLSAANPPRAMHAIPSARKGLQLAIRDLLEGFASVRIWSMLAWQDVKQRYRRSVLGPLWLTISTGVMIGGMGPLFAKLFNQDISSYLGFLAIGFVLWQLISQTILDGCQAFISAEGFIKQIKLPLSIYILKVVWKNLIMFFHNFIVVLAVFVFLPPTVSSAILLFPLAMLLLALNGVWVCVALALICTRFRDIPQIVASFIQIAFFLTPVMWQPQMLGRHMWAVELNPLYHFIELVRAPLLGSPVRPTSWVIAIAITVIGYAAMLALYSRYRSRVAFWV